jgi:signal transduction histidine kinase
MRDRSIVPLFALLTLGLIFWSIESRVTKTRIKKTDQQDAPLSPLKKKTAKEKAEKTAHETIPVEFDIEAKRIEVEKLVNKAVIAFEKSKTLEQIFNTITSGQELRKGELYCFVYDIEGTCMAIGADTEMIWQDFYNYRDSFNFPVVQRLIEKGVQGGGWVTYEWFNAVKVAFVKKVTKFSKDYIIGAGYYPFSKKDNVVMLVKGAVALFKQNLAEGKPNSDAFSEFGYPLGRFVLGDLYIYAVSFKGEHVAHGERSGLIGTNGWDYRDSEGKYVNREIVAKLKETSEGVWIEYFSKRAPKMTYAEKIADAKGNEYFIACGYYPDADRKATVDLVDKGYKFLKSNGISAAAEQFNDIDNPEFRYGDLYLSVYDMKGKCLADGANIAMVGTNMFDAQDEAGRYYVREIIEKAKKGSGWLDFKFKNSFKSVYVDIVDMGTEKLAICSGLYPSSKMETMILLAKSGASYLRTAPKTKEAFAAFVKPIGNKFRRGDLSVFAFAKDGICFAYGDNHDLIWQNLTSMKDSSGTSIVDLFNETVEHGSGKVMYTTKEGTQIAYLETVEREGTTYVVGSSFYR